MKALRERWHQRRRLRLEHWVAVWIFIPGIVLQLAGCEVVLFAGCCNYVCDEIGDKGDVNELTVLAPVEGTRYVGPVQCDFTATINREGSEHDVTVYVRPEPARELTWTGTAIDCTPFGDSREVAYAMTAVSNENGHTLSKTATIQWEAVPTMQMFRCAGFTTDCEELDPSEIHSEFIILKPILSNDQSLITGVTFTIDGVVVGTATAAPWAVEIDPQAGRGEVTGVNVRVSRSCGPDILDLLFLDVTAAAAMASCDDMQNNCVDAQGATLSGIVHLTTTALVLPNLVTEVAYQLDGVAIGTTAGSDTFTFDTATYEVGAHVLRAVYTRYDGGRGSVDANVTFE